MQKSLPNLSPGRTANAFAQVLVVIGTPAPAPKPRGQSPGWTPGQPHSRRIRYPTVRKRFRKPKTDKKKPEYLQADESMVPPPQNTSDRSEEIMKIGIEMKRLGWSTEQGREYLKRTYGKRSRQELDDAELLDFLHYLEGQPSPLQTPF
ncbi:hypothetical protein [Leptolyngbya sp. 7M]|uniref:hypothetical protein n=1 Tax=Leptolyngbya sp. 7M TaxID=2812896 RepID=UPI001B8C929E|nr:hypothetical protein [Leptolyngbya sp. 7M]QYO67858.1 hypothetical protein JVX88_14370 [Leptolyngbya sp. 7M]